VGCQPDAAARDGVGLARTSVAEAVLTDAAETAAFGDYRGDELPDIVASRQGREGWLRAARQRLDRERSERAEPIPRSRPERLREAKRRLEEEHAVDRDAHEQYEAFRARRCHKGRSAFRPSAESATGVGGAGRQGQCHRCGFQARAWGCVAGSRAGTPKRVCNERHLILAAELMTASPDFGHLAPMLAAR
jgi:hypothetical protein